MYVTISYDLQDMMTATFLNDFSLGTHFFTRTWTLNWCYVLGHEFLLQIYFNYILINVKMLNIYYFVAIRLLKTRCNSYFYAYNFFT